SRRRHTRLQGDWSSDVCSSDLGGGAGSGVRGRVDAPGDGAGDRLRGRGYVRAEGQGGVDAAVEGGADRLRCARDTEVAGARGAEIGRASCRERGEGTVGDGYVK